MSCLWLEKQVMTTIDINSEATEVKWFPLRLCWENWQSRKSNLPFCDCEINCVSGCSKRLIEHPETAKHRYVCCSWIFSQMHISRLFYKQPSFLVLKLFCVEISVTFPGFLYVHLLPPTTFVQNELNMCSAMVCSIPPNHVLFV